MTMKLPESQTESMEEQQFTDIANVCSLYAAIIFISYHKTSIGIKRVDRRRTIDGKLNWKC